MLPSVTWMHVKRKQVRIRGAFCRGRRRRALALIRRSSMPSGPSSPTRGPCRRCRAAAAHAQRQRLGQGRDSPPSCGNVPATPRCAPSNPRCCASSFFSQILDVRPKVQFGIGALPHSVNLPLPELERCTDEEVLRRSKAALQQIGIVDGDGAEGSSGAPVVVVCRRGNDSQKAVLLLRRLADEGKMTPLALCDLAGGLRSWSRNADPNFPIY